MSDAKKRSVLAPEVNADMDRHEKEVVKMPLRPDQP